MHTWFTHVIYWRDLLTWFTHVIYSRDLLTWFTHVMYSRDLLTWFTHVIYSRDSLTWFTHVIHSRDLLTWFAHVIYSRDDKRPDSVVSSTSVSQEGVGATVDERESKSCVRSFKHTWGKEGWRAILKQQVEDEISPVRITKSIIIYCS